MSLSSLKKVLGAIISAITVVFLLTNWSCKDKNDDGYYNIPDVYVNKTLNLDLPSYSQLNYVGGYFILLNEGYKGIIIYHNMDEEIIAMDMACTNNPLDSCAQVNVLTSHMFLQCGHYIGSSWIACCNSKFQMDGQVVEGPAKYPLKRYQVMRNGSMITITN